MRDAAPREGRRDPLAEQQLLTGRLVSAPGLREFFGMKNLARVVEDGAETDEVGVDRHAHPPQAIQQDIGGLADKDTVLQEPWRRTEPR
jgi:hypothetical protein